MNNYDIIIVGGGASGFFTANILLDKNPSLQVLMLEKTDKLLQKVKISGGGRCNVTHYEFNPTTFSKNYPRGQKLLKKNLRTFGAEEMIEWLSSKGVDTKTEEDGRMFPESNSSQTIIDCLLSVLELEHFTLKKKSPIIDFQVLGDRIQVIGQKEEWTTKKLVLSTGSSKSIWKLLAQKKIRITPPVPSLFTFTLRDHPLKGLEGISITNASIKVASTKLQESGPLLITHKGISGPAVLKLSAFGAKELAAMHYHFTVIINFTGLEKEEEVRSVISELEKSKKLLANESIFGLSKRLWHRILERSDISASKVGIDLSKKEKNKLINELYQGHYIVEGKNTFKEEFVTAGGIDLTEIDRSTYEFKKLPGVYAVGELLDIDGVTGGFNFQGCWTSGWIVGNTSL